MKRFAVFSIFVLSSVFRLSAHWSDSYNGDHEEIGPVATIIGGIVLIILAGIFEEMEKKK